MSKRRHARMRKGQVEVHFNWIFVLIIGAVILAFFLFVISRQRMASNQRLATDVLANMELILTGQEKAVGREDLVDIPEIPFTFACDAYGMLQTSKRTGNAIIFAPDVIDAEKLITWTQSWDVPFRVTSMLYITSPDIRYYLIFDPADAEAKRFAEDLNSSLPERMDNVMVENPAGSVPSIEYENNDKVRLMYILQPGGTDAPGMPAGLEDVDDKIVTALSIRKNIDTGEIYDGGALVFYKKRDDRFEIDFTESNIPGAYPAIGRESLYGAVFADDFDLYACAMQKAIKRLKFIALIYNARTNELLSRASPRCATVYSLAPFTTFALLEPADLTSETTATPTVDGLMSAAQALKNLNLNAIRASCTTLY